MQKGSAAEAGIKTTAGGNAVPVPAISAIWPPQASQRFLPVGTHISYYEMVHKVHNKSEKSTQRDANTARWLQ